MTVGGSIIALAIVGAYVLLVDPAKTIPDVSEQISQVTDRVRPEDRRATVRIGERVFTMRIADTNDSRAQGLQNVETLNTDEGMMFTFEGGPSVEHFWNKNTLMHLNVVWVRDNIIIGVDELLPEPTNGRMIVSSPERVNAVLEIPASAGLEGITPGTRIDVEL
jgi:uncharacterized membrane protein (UPF0127 family)